MKQLQCLGLYPDQRTGKKSCSDIVDFAKTLQLEVSQDLIVNEFKMYQNESDLHTTARIDDFWGHVFSLKCSSSSFKYPNLAKVVKAALILFHGNTDVERGFSILSHILTQERSSVSERTLNAILTVKKGL